ncbi:PepSY domain-containing protein [Frankia sp. AgPm24]|uniref:PepSY-associated TM helix domain-containing protein n=1 Tax=Frankia sp. AgPm24 TaxID=631128 RepID=UPI00200BB980|nr:PepSY domain-containing protein [Frankia sp. AgPm24]MCK9921362.1 PepSY domain-containing protein [Frankia sp. AgPm24]
MTTIDQTGHPPDDQSVPPAGPAVPSEPPTDPATPPTDLAALPAVPEPRQPDAPDASASDPPTSAPAPTSGGVRLLVLRLHFYAGVLVAPFLVVAALTGLAYTFTPQLDRLVYADEFHVDQVGAAPRPLSEQIDAALAAHPEGTFASVLTGDAPDRTTRVVLNVPDLGEKQRTVYVDPYTNRVQGALTTWWGSTPLTTWLDDLHRNLHLGALGRHYSEVAASWLWVVSLGGLVLWLGRRRRSRRMRRVLLPDLAARGRRRTMSWHGSLGVWLLVGLLFLSATGLTWSRYAGAHFATALDATDSHTPDLDIALPQTAAPAGATGGAHQGHTTTGAGGTAETSAARAGGVDRVAAAARGAGLHGPVEITPPTEAGTGWSVAQTDRRWPVRLDQVAVDPADGHVVREVRWTDWPLLAKLTKLGVAAHMGLLFGLVNQILLAGLAIGLICVIVWGYRMWWQRRPTRADRSAVVGPAPARGTWRRLPRPTLVAVILLTAAVGWALPVLGVTLAAFLAFDAAAGLIRARRRQQTGNASAA